MADDKSITINFDSEAIKIIESMSTGLVEDIKQIKDGSPTFKINEFVATLNKLAKLLEVERTAYNKLCEDRLNWIKDGMSIALSTRLAALAVDYPEHKVVMVKVGSHLDDVKEDGMVVYINENTEVIHVQNEEMPQ